MKLNMIKVNMHLPPPPHKKKPTTTTTTKLFVKPLKKDETKSNKKLQTSRQKTKTMA